MTVMTVTGPIPAEQLGITTIHEHLSGLDRRLRDRVRTDTSEVLRELSIATLLVTHDSEEAMLMSDSISLMRDGVVVQSGTADELYSRPESAFVASFFGEVNVIEGMAQNGVVITPIGTLATLHKDGCKVRVFIRPEGLNLDAGPGDEATTAEAEIIESHMLGPICLVRLKMAGNVAPLTARVNEGGLWKTGKRVRIRLDPERSFVFPAGQKCS